MLKSIAKRRWPSRMYPIAAIASWLCVLFKMIGIVFKTRNHFIMPTGAAGQPP